MEVTDLGTAEHCPLQHEFLLHVPHREWLGS